MTKIGSLVSAPSDQVTMITHRWGSWPSGGFLPGMPSVEGRRRGSGPFSVSKKAPDGQEAKSVSGRNG